MRLDLLRQTAGALLTPAFCVVLSALAWSATGGTARAGESAFACEAGERVTAQPRRLSQLAAAVQAGRPVTILAIGSSSTEGVGASASARSYPAQLEQILQTRWPRAHVTVVNAGVGGETAPRTVERLAERLAVERFDLVIWQVGTNDAIRGEGEPAFRDLVNRGIQLVRHAGPDIVILDPQFFPKIRDPEGYERFVKAIWETAEAGGVPVFSRYRLMKAWSARGEDALLSTLAGDRFHMNDRGYACIARTLSVDIADMVRMGAAVAAGR
jgi:acyl-CoA thioesterase-1